MDEIFDSIYIGGICVLGAAITLILIGFGCKGICLNSYASSMQSAYGNVPGGSCFSTLQSWGAKGYLVFIVIVLSIFYSVGEFGKNTFRNYMKEYAENLSNSTYIHEWTDSIANTTHEWTNSIANTTHEWTDTIANTTHELIESTKDFINGEKENIPVGNESVINKLNSSERENIYNSTILGGNIDALTSSSPVDKETKPKINSL
jgi:hypothetical protein